MVGPTSDQSRKCEDRRSSAHVKNIVWIGGGRDAVAHMRYPNSDAKMNRHQAQTASPSISRRRFATLLASVVGLPLAGWPDANRTFATDQAPPHSRPKSYPLFDEAVSRVIPEAGFQSRIALKDSIVNLASHGVIDQQKFHALYGAVRPLPG